MKIDAVQNLMNDQVDREIQWKIKTKQLLAYYFVRHRFHTFSIPLSVFFLLSKGRKINLRVTA